MRANRPRRGLPAAVATGLCLLAALIGSCGRSPAAQVQTYTVRGRIEQLPNPDRPALELQIRHEAIPSFVDKTGKTVGMKQMIMPFPPAEGLSLTGLSVGDKVEFVFEVRWTGSPLYQVTRITPLPPETPLEWEGAQDAGGAGAG